jgi:Icc-related predicted phosphoesterase
MKIAAVSDLHGSYRDLPPMNAVDVVVVAGDFLASGKHVAELQDFASWVGGLRARHKVVVAGNHDLILEEMGREAAECMFPADVHYLQDTGVDLEGVRFYGSPWTPRFYDWAFMKPDVDLQAIWNQVPVGLDVLVTHGPPLGSLDWVKRAGGVGSKSLAEAIATRCRPRVHLFGHIHEWGGYVQVRDGTAYFNVATMDPYYCLRPSPWTYIEI